MKQENADLLKAMAEEYDSLKNVPGMRELYQKQLEDLKKEEPGLEPEQFFQNPGRYLAGKLITGVSDLAGFAGGVTRAAITNPVLVATGQRDIKTAGKKLAEAVLPFGEVSEPPSALREGLGIPKGTGLSETDLGKALKIKKDSWADITPGGTFDTAYGLSADIGSGLALGRLAKALQAAGKVNYAALANVLANPFEAAGVTSYRQLNKAADTAVKNAAETAIENFGVPAIKNAEVGGGEFTKQWMESPKKGYTRESIARNTLKYIRDLRKEKVGKLMKAPIEGVQTKDIWRAVNKDPYIDTLLKENPVLAGPVQEGLNKLEEQYSNIVKNAPGESAEYAQRVAQAGKPIKGKFQIKLDENLEPVMQEIPMGQRIQQIPVRDMGATEWYTKPEELKKFLDANSGLYSEEKVKDEILNAFTQPNPLDDPFIIEMINQGVLGRQGTRAATKLLEKSVSRGVHKKPVLEPQVYKKPPPFIEAQSINLPKQAGLEAATSHGGEARNLGLWASQGKIPVYNATPELQATARGAGIVQEAARRNIEDMYTAALPMAEQASVKALDKKMHKLLVGEAALSDAAQIAPWQQVKSAVPGNWVSTVIDAGRVLGDTGLKVTGDVLTSPYTRYVGKPAINTWAAEKSGEARRKRAEKNPWEFIDYFNP